MSTITAAAKEQAIATKREMLATLEHDQWAHWMRYMFSQCDDELSSRGYTGGVIIPVHLVDRWKGQMHTPYSELTETEKDSDREWADKVLSILAEETP